MCPQSFSGSHAGNTWAGGNAINFDARIRAQGPAVQHVFIVRQQLAALFGELSTLDYS